MVNLLTAPPSSLKPRWSDCLLLPAALHAKCLDRSVCLTTSGVIFVARPKHSGQEMYDTKGRETNDHTVRHESPQRPPSKLPSSRVCTMSGTAGPVANPTLPRVPYPGKRIGKHPCLEVTLTPDLCSCALIRLAGLPPKASRGGCDVSIRTAALLTRSTAFLEYGVRGRGGGEKGD